MSESNASIPDFRHGLRPLYTTVSPRFLTKAWVNLCRNGERHIEYSRKIAEAMKASPGSAAKYRRVFNALDLIEDWPGKWNPDRPDIPNFDGSSIEDGTVGYSDYTDWSGENYPAEIIMKTKDPEALSGYLDGIAKIYVFRRTPPSDSPLSLGRQHPRCSLRSQECTICVQFFLITRTTKYI